MCSDDVLPCSPGLDRPLRTEAQALADYIEKRTLPLEGKMVFSVPSSEFDLIIRALRAYKPAPVTDTHHEFDGGDAA